MVAGIAGCGMSTTTPTDPISMTISGKVHGGQQGVVGAQVQLYAAGSAGNGSMATTLLTPAVVSVADGAFSITGDYLCPSSTAQVYIVATGGNPGLGEGDNPALAMVAALGDCGDLSATQYITINEVTTAAAAWTLAPFVHSYDSIGASGTNATGLENAFLNANLIVNTTTGTTATLPSNLTTETGKIDALADAIASCINSDGGSACTPLFSAATPNGGSAPTNTFDAAINIVKNPGNHVAGVFAAIGPQPPFPTTLTQAPNDWTLSLTVTGGGISNPTALGVDAEGNVWVADFGGLLSAYSPQGTPLSATGYGAGVLSEDFGLAVDPNGDVWVSVEEQPSRGSTKGSIVRLLGASSGGTMGTSTVFGSSAIDYPFGLAADSNGNILVADNAGSSVGDGVTVVDPGTATYTAFTGNHEIVGASALAPDGSHGIWVADGSDYSATHIDSSGNLLAATDCCGPIDALARDSAGNVWLSAFYQSDDDGTTDNGSIAELAPDGTVTLQYLTGGGVFKPSGVVVDAAQTVWVANYDSPPGQAMQSFSELAGSTTSTPGAALSPSTGFGLDAALVQPFALAVDASGNLWITNSAENSLVMFFGMAAPTKTPMPAIPTAP
jgi:sugar lactone lactonase YvrE